MSLGEALNNPVVRLYVIVVASILVGAGALLLLLKYGLKKDVGRVVTIYKSWLIMAPVVIGCVILGRVPVILLVGVLSIAGFKEFARATGLYDDWWMTGIAYLGIATVTAASLWLDPGDGSAGWFGFFMAAPVFAISAILLVPILRNRVEGQLQAVSLAIVGFIYVGWMFGHLGFLANADHAYAYVLYLLVAVELNDVAAFTFGKAFGRHKLRSNISPKKTWEGALGAFAVSMALPWALRSTFPHFGIAQLLWTGAIVGIGGQLGDLSISVIKRDVGIKDMGVTIPGHGGILDRIDSLIYTVPLFFHMVNYYYFVKP
jgi:phosphatidate cytidylyltransferase